MTDARKAEHEYRHNKVPRIPQLPERNRQTPFTWVALFWVIFIAVSVWYTLR